MLGSSGQLYSREIPRASSLGPSGRNDKKNHSSKLQELALMLPVALRTGNKKLTKKEILQHILQYIQYLQRSIDVAKALLKFHASHGEGGFRVLGRKPSAGPVRRRHATPSSSPSSQKSHLWGACQKPRKKKLTRVSEQQSQAQKPRRSLALDKPERLVTTSSDQEEENTAEANTPPRGSNHCGHPTSVSSSSQGDGDGGRSQLTLLDVAENIIPCDIAGHICADGTQDAELDPEFEAWRAIERFYLLNKTQFCPRQNLVHNLTEEVDKEAPDADPWLPAWTAEDSPNGSPLALGPPQINTWSATGQPSEILGLSPSLFSSPSNILSEQILKDATRYLTEGLFEEVILGPEAPQEKDAPAQTPAESLSLCQSSVSLDHCYLSLSENSKALSSSSRSSDDTDTESSWEQEEDMQAVAQDVHSSSEEGEDYTWTPTRQALALPTAGRKARKALGGKGPVKPKESKNVVPRPAQVKKKCVNGFIMFCRMNRKQYIRACPGTASTAATKELAHLWRAMTMQERRPYCIKARRFSRQHNRIVKQDSSSSEGEDWEVPKPFYQLLAEKARASPEPASLPAPHRP